MPAAAAREGAQLQTQPVVSPPKRECFTFGKDTVGEEYVAGWKRPEGDLVRLGAQGIASEGRALAGPNPVRMVCAATHTGSVCGFDRQRSREVG